MVRGLGIIKAMQPKCLNFEKHMVVCYNTVS